MKQERRHTKEREEGRRRRMRNVKRFVMAKNSNYYLYVHLAFDKRQKRTAKGDQKEGIK